MLSLQSFLREGRVVGPCWEKLKPEGPKGLESCRLSLTQDGARAEAPSVQGYLAHKEAHPSGILRYKQAYLQPYNGPRGGAAPSERGTPCTGVPRS